MRVSISNCLAFVLSIFLSCSCGNTPGGPGKEIIVDILPGSGITDSDHSNDFSPYKLKVKAGTKITWVNRDNVIHFVNDKGRSFNSPILLMGDKYTFVFNNPGDYQYYCEAHRWMRGRIYVR